MTSISVAFDSFIKNLIDYFCEDDKVVSGNTFLPTGQTERNETTWSRIDVGKDVGVVAQFL